jgi:hypothetical protein
MFSSHKAKKTRALTSSNELLPSARMCVCVHLVSLIKGRTQAVGAKEDICS